MQLESKTHISDYGGSSVQIPSGILGFFSVCPIDSISVK